MYYDGQLRQRGAGLGDVFRVLARTLAPTVLSIGKNFVKRKAATLGPKALEAGVGWGGRGARHDGEKNIQTGGQAAGQKTLIRGHKYSGGLWEAPEDAQRSCKQQVHRSPGKSEQKKTQEKNS